MLSRSFNSEQERPARMDMHEIADQTFIEDIVAEITKARSRFPTPDPTIVALTKKVGELSQAMLHMREGQHNDWWRVWNEAVQVAVMAMRAATEGDATLGVVPTCDNCR